jgi:hypothetical protein
MMIEATPTSNRTRGHNEYKGSEVSCFPEIPEDDTSDQSG